MKNRPRMSVVLFRSLSDLGGGGGTLILTAIRSMIKTQLKTRSWLISSHIDLTPGQLVIHTQYIRYRSGNAIASILHMDLTDQVPVFRFSVLKVIPLK